MTDCRIALFINAPGGGGISRMVVRLAIALHQRGCQVDLLVDRQSGKSYLHPDTLPTAIRVVDLDCPIRGGTLQSLRLLPALVRYLRRDRPALLLCHLTRVNGAAALAQRFAPATRLVLVEHLPLPPPAGRGARLARSLRPWLYRQAGAIVAVSADLARDFAQQLHLPPTHVRTIYNPVVSPQLAQLAAAELPHPWLQPDAPPVILAIGRLVPQKDFATLVRAAALLHQQRSLRLVILGSGPQQAELLALATSLGLADNLLLPGYVENPYAYLSRAAVLALSSRFEGLPTVLIEALACGCQVVATDSPHAPAKFWRRSLWTARASG
ncbi:MAG: glycosyltransferase [Spirulinaceae cyanobacterium RM2_2_10]|nr:glycosyltransferase [Spirulinaceae cyanobacterium RM2_2_10]